ncbi:MAG: hypothetical protein E6J14_05580 [Chloroflexi bacterium]|nr:MAG: hypothetical protein E6J14_05580 [Chloroflexota bacterium]
MRPSPGLVMAVLLVLLAAQLTRLVVPGRGPYLWTLLLAAAGVAAGEILAGSGHFASPVVGVIHPVPDAAATALLEAGGALLLSPRRT